jgi:hypothetical protein
MLMVSGVTSVHVRCDVPQAQFRRAKDELDAEKIEKQENGGGTEHLEHAKRAMSKLHSLTMPTCRLSAAPTQKTIDDFAR